MSKPKGLPASRNKIKLRGQMHTATARGGVLIMKKWPSVPPQIYSDARLASARAFSWACWVTRYAIDLDLISAKKYSQNTLYLPRDLLIMAMYGTLVQVTMRDGTRLWSARKLSTEIQALLDQLSTEIGTIITRGADGWIAISPSVDGDVLTTHGAGKIPTWQPASGGSGGGITNVVSVGRYATGTDTTAFAIKGTIIQATRTIDVHALQLAFTNVRPVTVQPCILKLSGVTGTITVTDVALGTAETLTSATPDWTHLFTLPSVYTLNSGAYYLIGGCRTDGSGTTSLPIERSVNNVPMVAGPIQFYGTGKLASKAPATGNAITASITDGAPFSFELFGTWTP